MIDILYKGTRNKPFTLKGVNTVIHITPGEVVSVSNEDADNLLSDGQAFERVNPPRAKQTKPEAPEPDSNGTE